MSLMETIAITAIKLITNDGISKKANEASKTEQIISEKVKREIKALHGVEETGILVKIPVLNKRGNEIDNVYYRFSIDELIALRDGKVELELKLKE